MTSAWLVAAAIALPSCQRPADAPESLVGTANLPTARQLSQESILINLPGPDQNLLTFELHPDNRLTITHYEDTREREIVRGQEIFRLAADRADRARRRLWRVRPADLKGLEWETLPIGCPRQLHPEIEVMILFIAPGDRIGAFALADHCRSADSRTARNLVAQVVRSFPASEVAARFRSLQAAHPDRSHARAVD